MRGELHGVPAGAKAQDQAAAGDLVDGRGQLRQHERRVERGRRHERPDGHALRRLGEAGQRRPGLPGSAGLAARVPVQEVVADPDRVEAGLLGGAGDGAELRPADLALHLGQLDADPEGAAGSSRDHGAHRTASRPAQPPDTPFPRMSDRITSTSAEPMIPVYFARTTPWPSTTKIQGIAVPGHVESPSPKALDQVFSGGSVSEPESTGSWVMIW